MYFKVNLTTLDVENVPVPHDLQGLNDKDLADLSWTDPALGYHGFGWWPGEHTTPEYSQATHQLGELIVIGAVPQTHSVQTTSQVVAKSAEQLAAELKAKRDALLPQVAARRVTEQRRGKVYVFPDGLTGTIQIRDEQDLVNINGRVTVALVLQAQGVVDPVLTFRDVENVTHAMTPAQMIQMGMAASQFVSDTYAAKWAHDSAIAAWDGVEPYDLSTGWPV